MDIGVQMLGIGLDLQRQAKIYFLPFLMQQEQSIILWQKLFHYLNYPTKGKF
jgi:hypothetical protein